MAYDYPRQQLRGPADARGPLKHNCAGLQQSPQEKFVLATRLVISISQEYWYDVL